MLKYLYRLLHPKFQKLFLEYPVDMKPRYGHGKPPHADLYAIIDAHRKRYASLLEIIVDQKEALWQIKKAGEEVDSSLPVWNNGFLPGLDIAAIYGLLSHFKPSKYVEIGSGNSTKVAYKAIGDHGLPTQITSIDPMPRTEIDELANTVVRKAFEDCDLKLFEKLDANDILFVDNSHRILPNSDATTFFLEVLPKLRPGVIVHIHDIYLPYDYPPFMCERFYSEQYGLAMYLLANPQRYQPLLPNYFVSEDKDLSSILKPLWDKPEMAKVEKHGGSFWLQIV